MDYEKITVNIPLKLMYQINKEIEESDDFTKCKSSIIRTALTEYFKRRNKEEEK